MPIQDTLDSPFLTDDSSSIAGGVVDNVESHLLRPDQIAYLLNMKVTTEGRRVKRFGVDAVAGRTETPKGLFDFEATQYGIRNLAAIYGNNLYITTGNEILSQKACGVSFCDTHYMGVVGRGATNTATLYMTTCVPMTDNVSLPFGKLIAMDRGYNFTEIQTVRPRALAWFQSRLWTLNSCQTSHGQDYLHWSNPFDGRNFSGQNVQLETDTGDPGIGLVPMRDQTPRMMIFKQRSIHLLEIYWNTDGYYTTSANALDFTKSLLRPVTLETGAVSSRAIVWSPGLQGADVMYLSREGIRSLNRSLTDAQGGAGLPVSYRIQTTIDRINWATADRSVAIHWNGIIYFAVPVDGNIEPNFIIAYDVYRDAFSFLDWKVGAWATAELQSQRYLYFLSNTAVTEQFTSGPSNAFNIYQTETGFVDPGASPIQYEEHSRGYTFDIDGPGSGLRNRKRWRWLDLAVQAGNTACTLAIYFKVDADENWTFLDYLAIDPSDAYPRLPTPLPITFSSTSLVRRKISLHTIRPGFKLQFRNLDITSFAALKILQQSLVASPYQVTFD